MQPNATYTFNAEEEQPAAVTLLKAHLQIKLWMQGTEKIIIWHYDQVVQDAAYPKMFAYAAYPPQLLSFTSAGLAAELAHRIAQKKKVHFSKRRTLFISAALFMVALLIAVYFLALPWVAARFATRVPVRYEEELGAGIYNSMKESFTIDAAKTAYLNDFYRQLHIPSRYHVNITVVKGNEVNAFALPGGHIVVYDKIIDGMTSYPELAALLAHEFTHIEERHSLKSLFRQMSSVLFFSFIIGDAGGIADVIIGNADNLKNLSYSRQLENEADEKGLHILMQRNIDCKGFERLFRLLSKHINGEPSEWISSHPALNKRIKNIQQQQDCRQQTTTTDATLHHLFLKIKTS